jgi:hypothetical protein
MPIGGPHFSSVKKAREALKERANELLDIQIAIIKGAMSKGDYETAAKANQFLMEHIPDEDGTRMIDQSVDKPKQLEAKLGPSINIGFAIGGINQPKELPPAVIEAEPVPDDK